ncbi:MAG: Lrp/AsnC family transcriptional regulator [Candidatus Bathyarchaeota archaeon]|nr:MAG: Lrp/AsnC family transcriptional regulator [Candidatus Bathyarchaeota archaeon]
MLLEDGRKKFTDIAEICNVTTSKIKQHYYKLKEKGVIKKSTTYVNQKKLGFQGHLSVCVNVKFGQIEKFMNYARKINGATTYQVKLNGNYNVHVLIPLKNMNEIEEKTQKIKDHPTVINFKSNIWTEIELFPKNLSVLH